MNAGVPITAPSMVSVDDDAAADARYGVL